MKVKTSDLIGSALDWAVAKCEFPNANTQDIEVWVQPLPCDDLEDFKFQPSTDWAQGGPIIERHCINLFRLDPKTEEDNRFWIAHVDGIYCRYGVSALMAAMRCYVASKLGDEVEIPEELAK